MLPFTMERLSSTTWPTNAWHPIGLAIDGRKVWSFIKSFAIWATDGAAEGLYKGIPKGDNIGPFVTNGSPKPSKDGLLLSIATLAGTAAPCTTASSPPLTPATPPFPPSLPLPPLSIPFFSPSKFWSLLSPQSPPLVHATLATVESVLQAAGTICDRSPRGMGFILGIFFWASWVGMLVALAILGGVCWWGKQDKWMSL